LPKKFWPEVVAQIVFTKYQIPHHTLLEPSSPIEVLKLALNITNERLRFGLCGDLIWIYSPTISLSHNKILPGSENGQIASSSTGYKTYSACTEKGSFVLTKNPKPRIIVLHLGNFQYETIVKITRLGLVHTQSQSWNFQRRFLSRRNTFWDHFLIRPSVVTGPL
jgi:hypothetical protein